MNKVKINLKGFFEALGESYKEYLQYGSRSTEKLRPIHRWIAKPIKCCLEMNTKYII